MTYVEHKELSERLKEAQRVLSKYPGRIPLIVECEERSIEKLGFNMRKLLISGDKTMGQLMSVLRKQVNISPSQGVFMLINKTLPVNTATVQQVYDEHKAPDNLLYVTLCRLATFGATHSCNYTKV